MRTVALISGGKDSCFNMLQCEAAGHEIVALANLLPAENSPDEMDSYMYQTVGHDTIEVYSEAMGLPLYRECIRGTSLQLGLDYIEDEADEVEDLYRLLFLVREDLGIEAVSVGAILSNYQRVRVENVCRRLGLTCLSYLWRRDQQELLDEMISSGINAVLIKVAALGLDPHKYLGRSLQDSRNDLLELNKKFGINVCGEGGEYETITLDCPMFKKMMVIEETETVTLSKDPFSPVAYLKFRKIRLVDKGLTAVPYTPIRAPKDFCRNELEKEEENEKLIVDTPAISFTTDLPELPEYSNYCLNDSGLLFLSGITVASESDLERMLDSLKQTLEMRGTNMENLISICLCVRDMTDYPRLNTIYGRRFNLNPPVRVCFQVPMKNYALIEAVAVTPTTMKKIMHVQSVSHWAPANIGPYSQAVQLMGQLIMVSGQIGLIPGSMTLPHPPNFLAECRLALRHARRILEAMDKDVDLSYAFQVICFVRIEENIPLAKAIWIESGGRFNHPIVFVVINQLPRGALVEWQIFTHQEPCTIQRCNSDTIPGSNIVLVKKDDAISVTCFLDQFLDKPEDCDALMDLLAVPLGQSYSLRIYFRSDSDPGRWKQLKTSETTSVTLIPIRSLESHKVAVICAIRI